MRYLQVKDRLLNRFYRGITCDIQRFHCQLTTSLLVILAATIPKARMYTEACSVNIFSGDFWAIIRAGSTTKVSGMLGDNTLVPFTLLKSMWKWNILILVKRCFLYTLLWACKLWMWTDNLGAISRDAHFANSQTVLIKNKNSFGFFQQETFFLFLITSSSGHFGLRCVGVCVIWMRVKI